MLQKTITAFLLLLVILLFLILITLSTIQIDLIGLSSLNSFKTPESGWWSAITILVAVLVGSFGLTFFKKSEIEELKKKDEALSKKIEELGELASLSTISLNFHSEYGNADNKWAKAIANLEKQIKNGFIDYKLAYHLSVQAWREGHKYYTYLIRKASYEAQPDNYQVRTELANCLTHIFSDYRCFRDKVPSKIDKKYRLVIEDEKRFRNFISYDKYYPEKDLYIPPHDTGATESNPFKRLAFIANRTFSKDQHKLYLSIRADKAPLDDDKNSYQKAIEKKIWHHVVLGRYYLYVHLNYEKALLQFEEVLAHQEFYFYHHMHYSLASMNNIKLLEKKVKDWDNLQNQEYTKWQNPSTKSQQFFKNFIHCHISIYKGLAFYLPILFENICMDDVLTFLNADDYAKYKMINILQMIEDYEQIDKNKKSELKKLFKTYYLIIGSENEKLDEWFEQNPNKRKKIMATVLNYFNT